MIRTAPTQIKSSPSPQQSQRRLGVALVALSADNITSREPLACAPSRALPIGVILLPIVCPNRFDFDGNRRNLRHHLAQGSPLAIDRRHEIDFLVKHAG